MRRATIILALALGLSAAVALPTIEHEETIQVQGTIRWQSPDTWSAVVDEFHAAEGIKSVHVLADRVRVYYDDPASTVKVCSVSVDEQFAAAGVRVGASVGLAYVDVFFYMGTGGKAVDPALLTRRNANVWIDCEHAR